MAEIKSAPDAVVALSTLSAGAFVVTNIITSMKTKFGFFIISSKFSVRFDRHRLRIFVH